MFYFIQTPVGVGINYAFATRHTKRSLFATFWKRFLRSQPYSYRLLTNWSHPLTFLEFLQNVCHYLILPHHRLHCVCWQRLSVSIYFLMTFLDSSQETHCRISFLQRQNCYSDNYIRYLRCLFPSICHVDKRRCSHEHDKHSTMLFQNCNSACGFPRTAHFLLFRTLVNKRKEYIFVI